MPVDTLTANPSVTKQAFDTRAIQRARRTTARSQPSQRTTAPKKLSQPQHKARSHWLQRLTLGESACALHESVMR